MSLPLERRSEGRMAAVAGAAMILIFPTAQGILVPGGLILLFFFFGLLFLFRYRNLKTVSQHLALLLFGFLYLSLPLGHLSLLRNLPMGREWVFLTILIIMAGDTAAYFIGSSIGRHRLYPAISPKKSVEGAIGGLAGSLGGAFLAKWVFLPSLDFMDALILGLVVGSFGQLGDLFESMLKRGCGVKDSGAIIPGHGGILDRLDSLLFAFPPVFYYAILVFPKEGI